MLTRLFHTIRSFFQTVSRNDLLLGIFILFLLIELSGFFGSLVEQLELWNFSLRQRSIVESREDSHINIIGIDDYTLTSPDLKRVFGRSPFRRDLYKYLIEYMDRAQAKYLAMDLGFSGGDDQLHPKADDEFAEAVKASTIPVASVISSNASEQTAINLKNVQLAAKRSQINLSGALHKIRPNISNTAQGPLKKLVETPMQFLFSNSLKTDVTGTVRRANLLTTLEFPPSSSNLSPTFPLLIALEGEKDVQILPNGDFKTAQKTFAFQDESHPIIRWYGDNTKASRLNHGSLNQKINQRQFLGPISGYLFQKLNQWKNVHPSLVQPSIYPEYSLWDIIYTELTYQCGQPGITSFPTSGKKQKSNISSVCQSFYASSAEPPTGKLIPPETFKGHYILLGTTYENNPGDTHATIYNKAHYHGVYIQANILDNILHNDFIKQAPRWWVIVISILFAALITLTTYNRPIVYSLTLFSAILGSYSFITLWLYQHQNLWLNWAIPSITTIVMFILGFTLRYLSTEKRKQQLRFAFGKYVSPGAMELIEKNPEKLSLNGERRELTILFTDIRGFTHFSETNTPEEVQRWLTEYFSVMNKIIFKHNGAINKLMGDAIMAYWGFPVSTEEAPLNAVTAAIEMREAMTQWNNDPDKPRFEIGVGINTGDVIIGNVGSQDFMDFTVIGDTVNVAARLESENKNQKTNIIISQSTYLHCKRNLHVRDLGNVHVKGKEEPILIYEPLSLCSKNEQQ